MGEVERLCDRVIMLKTGRIEDDDTPPKLIARYGRRNLEEVFLDIARGRGEAPAGRAMSTHRAGTASRSRRGASPRWCCATGICCARRGRACSI